MDGQRWQVLGALQRHGWARYVMTEQRTGSTGTDLVLTGEELSQLAARPQTTYRERRSEQGAGQEKGNTSHAFVPVRTKSRLVFMLQAHATSHSAQQITCPGGSLTAGTPLKEPLCFERQKSKAGAQGSARSVGLVDRKVDHVDGFALEEEVHSNHDAE